MADNCYFCMQPRYDGCGHITLVLYTITRRSQPLAVQLQLDIAFLGCAGRAAV